jgi:hypothetical protein
VGYQVASVVGGGFTPFIAAALVTFSGGNWHSVAIYLLAGCLLSAATALLMKETSHADLPFVSQACDILSGRVAHLWNKETEMNNKGSSLTPAQALEKLDALYEQSVNALRSAISEYIETGKLPDQKARTEGLFVYPSLSVTWDGSASSTPKTRAYARFTHSGCYSTTVTRPALFRPYLEEQLTLLYQDYGAHIAVEPSQHEIPYPYVIDGSALTLDRSMSAGLTRHFPTTELSQIGDETADGIYHPAEFSPCRTLMPAGSISPGAPAPLHRYASRTFPAVRAVYQLHPLRR